MKVGETSKEKKKVCECIYGKTTISKSVAGIAMRGIRE